MFLLHGFVAQQACLVLWLSKPVFLGNHQLTRVSHFFLWILTQSPSGINCLIPCFCHLLCPYQMNHRGKERDSQQVLLSL